MKVKKYVMGAFLSIGMLALVACNNASGANSSGEAATADNFPNKPIKIITGFDPGGIADTGARLLAKELGKNFDNKVDITVEAKPGGAGVVAMTEVINSKPDGYTIGFGPLGPVTLQPHFGQTTYQYDDPVMISQVASNDFMLAVHKDAPWDDFDSFLNDVKANPGKFSYSNPGAGTLGEIAMLTLARETGIEIKGVPFQGSTPARTALLAKDVDAAAIVETDLISYAQSGDIKILINFGNKKMEEFPDVPTAEEKGYNMNHSASFSLYGPKNLPIEIRDAIDTAVAKTMNEEEMKDAFVKIGLPPNYLNADEATESVDKEYHVNKEAIEYSGK
ncbi:tripartite tricarboxylate transporter substrate binding protein [Sporosarcina sp. 179-K 3D1 HS]|uniref:tripartite tricarboxylate transporter substrate binding protein n=1 Tax=Sporosarcina sp. 179-K 3D1 HS TaxID=3232169 RepID=UPI00399FEA99